MSEMAHDAKEQVFTFDQASYIEGEISELDFLLDAARDVATAGRLEAEGAGRQACGRFFVIEDLLRTYSTLRGELIEHIYPEKAVKEA